MRIHTSVLVTIPVSVSFDYNPDGTTPICNLRPSKIDGSEELTIALMDALSKESKSWKEIYDDYIANEK